MSVTIQSGPLPEGFRRLDDVLTEAEWMAFAEFQMKELFRHLDDAMKIMADLNKLRDKGIVPTGKHVSKWFEVPK